MGGASVQVPGDTPCREITLRLLQPLRLSERLVQSVEELRRQHPGRSVGTAVTATKNRD